MKTRIALALALAAVVAVPALAAPDRNATLNASSPSFAWDGGPGSSIGFNTGVIGGASAGNFVGCAEGIAECEETLLKVETAGKLTVTANADDDSTDAIDLYLFESDAEGTYDDSGSDMADGDGAGTTGDEKIEVEVAPGYYNAVVKFFDANEDTYKGAAVLSGFAAPPPAAATPTPRPAGSSPPAQPQQPSSTPAPASTPAPKPKAKKKKSKRAACQKKAKKIKNSKKRKKALKKCKKIKG